MRFAAAKMLAQRAAASPACEQSARSASASVSVRRGEDEDGTCGAASEEAVANAGDERPLPLPDAGVGGIAPDAHDMSHRIRRMRSAA